MDALRVEWFTRDPGGTTVFVAGGDELGDGAPVGEAFTQDRGAHRDLAAFDDEPSAEVSGGDPVQAVR
jgi:hypothetical protein